MIEDIVTDRLVLRAMSESDTGKVFELFNDERVMASFGGGKFSVEQARGWVERNLRHQEQHGFGLFSVTLRDSREWIGDCGLECGDHDGVECVEIGYDLLSCYWGNGYATEAAHAVKEAAVARYGIEERKLCCFVRTGNHESDRVAEKIGMQVALDYKRADISYRLYSTALEYWR